MHETTLVCPFNVCTRWPGECRKLKRFIGPDFTNLQRQEQLGRIFDLPEYLSKPTGHHPHTPYYTLAQSSWQQSHLLYLQLRSSTIPSVTLLYSCLPRDQRRFSAEQSSFAIHWRYPRNHMRGQNRLAHLWVGRRDKRYSQVTGLVWEEVYQQLLRQKGPMVGP